MGKLERRGEGQLDVPRPARFEGVELIDFYQPPSISKMPSTAHGADSPKAAAQFKKYRHLLRHEPDGVNTRPGVADLRSRLRATSESRQVLGYPLQSPHDGAL